MNAEQQRELFSAALDGELSPTERKVMQQLLHDSEEARVLFAQLKYNASRLKKLPRAVAPPQLAERVMSAIGERRSSRAAITPSAVAPKKFDWPKLQLWLNFSAAAAVLLLISLGSYFHFSANQTELARQQAALASKGPTPKNSDLPGTTKTKNPEQPNKVETPLPEEPKYVAQQPKPLVPELGPEPRVVEADVITSPLHPTPEIEPFQLDRIRVSQIFSLRDLPAEEETRKKLLAELKKDELLRLDLFCQATPKSFDTVQAALKARGITLFIDAFVLERFKKKLPTEVVIFTEAMTPTEVAQLLNGLGVEERKVEPEAGQFEALVVAPFLPIDLDKLGKLLGASSVMPKMPKTKTGIDIRKPLPEGTAAEMARSLSKMGTGGSAKSDKLAIAVSYTPMNTNPAASKEIKLFLDQRAERKLDARPLMLVLRTVK